MRTPFKDKQRGTSLIELMIASSLLALIAVAASAFFKRVNSSDVEARAKAGAISEITLFLSTIERDFRFRQVPGPSDPPIPDICASSSICQSMAITRMVQYKSTAGALAGKHTTMAVDYQTKCIAAPSQMKTKFSNELSMKKNNAAHGNTNYTTGDSTRSNALNGRCFKLANCANGQYAQVQITTHPVGPVVVPSYPGYNPSSHVAKFPDLTKTSGAASGVIGAGLCGESTGISKSDRITLEAAFVNSEGQMRIEKREVSIPRNNVANIQILPSN